MCEFVPIFWHHTHFSEDVRLSSSCPLQTVNVEQLTEVFSTMNMRSCLIFPSATVAQSGNYICYVHETVQDQRASASINITVLG